MTLIYAVVLGIVQGLTEFLPVSSSGHLVLLNRLFGPQENFLLFSVLLHLATLLAVLIVFHKDVKQMILHPFCPMAKKIYVSFVPTALIVLLFKNSFEMAFEGKMVSVCFLITALILLVCDFFAKERKKPYQLDGQISYKNAFVIGICQGFAAMPGISRSGSTICAGLLLGENREEVAKFSFLMSIPVIVCSVAYEIIFSGGLSAFSGASIFPVLCGFLCAFLVGILAVKFMLKVVKRARYFWFSIYLVILGILSIIYL
ncbi:MAG: undecaprenyl-diphosphate phosphatase [Clostridia bacterium]